MCFDVIFRHDVDYAQTNQRKAGFFLLSFWSERYGRYTYPKNGETPIPCVKKGKRKMVGFPFVCTYRSIDGEISDRNCQNWAGHRRNGIFPTCCRDHLTYIRNRGLGMFLNESRIGQGELYRSYSCVFSIVSIKFCVDRERRLLYELSVEKLVFFSFAGIGEIESDNKKLIFFHTFFFCMCSVVSLTGSVHQIF